MSSFFFKGDVSDQGFHNINECNYFVFLSNLTVCRILKAIESLSQMIESFPLVESKNPDLHEQVQAIRAKFKQVCSSSLDL